MLKYLAAWSISYRITLELVMHIFCAEKYCYSTQILNNHIRFWNRHIKACNVRVIEQVREPCISLLRCDVIMISFVKNCPLNILTSCKAGLALLCGSLFQRRFYFLFKFVNICLCQWPVSRANIKLVKKFRDNMWLVVSIFLNL